jgi:hypothetical protein
LSTCYSIYIAIDILMYWYNYSVDYGGFGDNVDSNSLNEIGQIASTGISDSSLQRLLGQLMAGQMGHADHMVTSQDSPGLGTLPNDASVFEQGNSEVSSNTHVILMLGMYD